VILITITNNVNVNYVINVFSKGWKGKHRHVQKGHSSVVKLAPISKIQLTPAMQDFKICY